MEAIFNHRDVDVDDIAIFEHLFIVWNAVTNDVVD